MPHKQGVNRQTCRDIMQVDDRKWWIIQEHMAISHCNSCKWLWGDDRKAFLLEFNWGYWTSALVHMVVTQQLASPSDIPQRIKALPQGGVGVGPWGWITWGCGDGWIGGNCAKQLVFELGWLGVSESWVWVLLVKFEWKELSAHVKKHAKSECTNLQKHED